MIVSSAPGSAFVEWLFRTSFQASLLICAVFAVLLVARDRISPRWRSVLWLLVLLRLLLPWSPRSSLAVYNLIPDPVLRVAPADHWNEKVVRHASDGADLTNAAEWSLLPAAAGSTYQERSWRLNPLFLAWLIGAVALAAWLLFQTVITIGAFRRRRPSTDRDMLELLEECKERIGVWAYLAVVETPRVRSPALFGWIRPRLLLPEGSIARLTREELRHVFMHELSHLKRHDIAVTWIMTLLQIVHWFNPLVWIAFRMARADMEPASDSLALSSLDDGAVVSYGRTIVRLLEAAAKSRRMPALAGLAEDAGQMKRRIHMIATFDANRKKSWLLPAGLTLALGIPFLANGAYETQPRPSTSATVAAPPGRAMSPPELKNGPMTPPENTNVDDYPIDAALQAAERWFALTDAGKFRESWREMHSYARKLISPGSWEALCTNQGLALARDGATKVIEREVFSVDYLTDLPHGLGDGVSITYHIKLDNGQRIPVEVIFVKDSDGQWRFARGKKIESKNGSSAQLILRSQAQSSAGVHGISADAPIRRSSPGQYPIDDAIKAARRFADLADSGPCARSEEERHSYVKKLMSLEQWNSLCESRVARLRQLGRISSRDVLATEYLPDLAGMGGGVRVTFKVALRTYDPPADRVVTEDVWLVKDSDRQWRMVRFDGKLEH